MKCKHDEIDSASRQKLSCQFAFQWFGIQLPQVCTVSSQVQHISNVTTLSRNWEHHLLTASFLSLCKKTSSDLKWETDPRSLVIVFMCSNLIVATFCFHHSGSFTTWRTPRGKNPSEPSLEYLMVLHFLEKDQDTYNWIEGQGMVKQILYLSKLVSSCEILWFSFLWRNRGYLSGVQNADFSKVSQKKVSLIHSVLSLSP